MILELKNIHKNFGGVTAIVNTSFAIKESEIFGLIGPNGAGKTTLFNIITGNYKPSSGEVFFLGKKIDHLKPHKIVHMGIARTFQNIRLFSSMSVLENVLIGFDQSIKYGIFEAFLHLGRFSREEKNAKKAAYEILEQLNIAHLADEKATSLSYGQQRKVEIARALATKPKLLLLDEPAAGMNSTESDDLAKLIFDIRDNKKISVLLIEHDMKFVNKLCDRVMVLDYGKTIFEGKPMDAVLNPEVISAYLGDFNASC
ncbi:high-affinity branched-chain amino acid transporter, ATP-binding protein [Campylobacter peloridis]|uniref:High-affinity branched-chain amino acid transporter, ATP-binding protein n=1 Tax=Campylobacter peloridis TaxID=488546 RepID=A0ABX6TSU7_9BACT|nr:high-affinity branched-chain amino acid transporter, ATP-binding protein [Campylobacter peloridis]AJC85031.1 high-affinity branched-chain amino acid transporter, ATP-binding protein [Campylobacter peloridis LMG 23910]MBX1886562.1 high-affinity branched-chain amino acid transporter, ATP-binding protein [Campylobacter peloridis]QOQ89066.1 high-affinity branched-chain amino acid transporter, ATP-binding protein [Campylobacter peloridis]